MLPTNGKVANNRILGPDGLPWTESDMRGGPESAFALPHVYSFTAMLGSAWKVYYRNRFDEAMRAGRSEVTAMKRDAFLMGIFFERRYKVLSQKLSIEVDNDKDPWQKAMKAGLMQIIRSTPRLRKLMKALYWAVWDGRAGAQVVYDFKELDMPSGKVKSMSVPGASPMSSDTGREKRKALCIRLHKPVQGDKITHHYDGTPIVMVNRAKINDVPNIRRDDLVNTEEGQGLVLRGTWRQRFIIHSHEWLDADFFDADEAEAIHGVGLRHFVYWLNTLRLEWLSNVADWCERTGLGVRLWYYQGGNPASKTAVTEAARNQSDRTNILIPKYGDRAVEGVDYIDTASNGADLLLRLQQHLEDIIERVVIGQTLSAHTEGHGLGGSGVAGMHEDTKFQIIYDDAVDLDESLVEDWLKLVVRWTWPEMKDVPFRLTPNFGSPNAKETLDGIKTIVDMGAKVRVEDGMTLLGLPAAEEGDDVFEKQEPMQMDGGMGGDPTAGLDDMGPIGPDEQAAMDELFGEDSGGEAGDPGGADAETDADVPAQFSRSGSVSRYAYDPQQHPHKPAGPGGGQFAPKGGGGSGGKQGHGMGFTPSGGKPQQSKKGKEYAAFGGDIWSHANKFAQAVEWAVKKGDQQKVAEFQQKATEGFRRVLAHRYLELKDRAVSTWGEQVLDTWEWNEFKNTMRNYSDDFNDQVDGLASGESSSKFISKLFSGRADRLNELQLKMHHEFGKKFGTFDTPREAKKFAPPDQIPGGKADNQPDSSFDPKSVAQGAKVESEHTDDPAKAKEIAKDHLTESGDYYDKLAVMEKTPMEMLKHVMDGGN